MVNEPDPRVRRLIDALRPKAKSLLVTIYGDAIAHRGGNAWLGSVIALAADVGLAERAVRTSVLRLAQEGWLASQQIGRRSYYRLTDDGRRRFDAAHERLYRDDTRPWDRHWTMVGLGAVDAAQRESLRRDLSWLGFGSLSGDVMLHPDPDDGALRQLLAGAEAAGDALALRGAALPMVTPQTLRATARSCWDLDRLGADYTAFLDTFRPVWQALGRAGHLEPRSAFAVRTLLMHGYRRACLRDPFLPQELLPTDWPGGAARLLCRNLYRRVQAAGERHVETVLETAEGPAPQATARYYARFGGLDRPAAR
jgi:phenylacetic acid degradation operon negative regulatory protein